MTPATGGPGGRWPRRPARPAHRTQNRAQAHRLRGARTPAPAEAARSQNPGPSQEYEIDSCSRLPSKRQRPKTLKKGVTDLRSQPGSVEHHLSPASCRAARCHCSSGWPCTCSRGLGAVSVSERMRSPRPAASNRSGTKCGGRDSCRHPAGVCGDPQPWAGTRPTARPISTCALAEWSAPKLHTHTALPCAARARRARTDAFCYQNSSFHPTRALRYGRKLLKQLPHGLQPGGATTSVQARPRAVAPSIEAKRARRWT